MTKKERDKQAKADQTGDVLHKASNATANLALGGKKKYSWMSAGPGGAKPPPARLDTAAAVAAATGAATGSGGPVTGSAATAKPKEAPALKAMGRAAHVGEWKEEGPRATGVQLRDWVTVLQRDGREKKTLGRTLLRMAVDEREPPNQP